MNRINIDLERTVGAVNPHLFGGFAELVGNVVNGGICDPESPLSDADGLRSDVRKVLERLNYSIVRFPGGNFVSGYRWTDGVGPADLRPARHDLAWNAVETNRFGTDEFITFCRKMNIEPYLCVNCGDGTMREAADWVEYCNGTRDSAPVQYRRKNGFDEPHNVKYWGIGNEVDGSWQIGFKTPYEYARALKEFAKVMKWTDPGIKLIAAANCKWDTAGGLDWVERGQLIMEQAGDLIDYLALHWYVGNEADDFESFMAVGELYEERLSAYEGLIWALCLEKDIRRPVYITVDEWGIRPKEFFALEDALVTAQNLNAFIRHAGTVKMANLTMLTTPMRISPDGVMLQTVFYPFELYRNQAKGRSLDLFWDSETFSTECEGHKLAGIRYLDVAATLDEAEKKLSVFVVNRSRDLELETKISLAEGRFSGELRTSLINAGDVKTMNTFDEPEKVKTETSKTDISGSSYTHRFEPHSVTVLTFDVE